MNAESEMTKAEPAHSQFQPPAPPAKPLNAIAVRKAVAIGKDMRKLPETSKADVARKMFEMIADEPREVIVQAFVDGAGLTPKGAQTYFYNCKRKSTKTT
jgi:hypothetical protein